MEKRLTKGKDKILFGVCSGIAEYFNIDPTLVRLCAVLLIFYFGIGILPYFIMAICMPANDSFDNL